MFLYHDLSLHGVGRANYEILIHDDKASELIFASARQNHVIISDSSQ